MSARYWSIPFGTTGDKTPIPNALQPDGAVSAPIGWGPNYEKEKTEAGYLPVSRKYTNQLAFDITSGLKDLQDFGAPAYYAEAAPYAINSIVRKDDKIWRSSIANNNSVPGATGASWIEILTSPPIASETVAGVVKLATSIQAIAGTDDSAAMTALKTKQAIAASTPPSVDGIAGAAAGLKLSATGASSLISISADSVCLKNAMGQQKVVSNLSLSLNGAITGINGIDVGAIAANTWYSIWIVSDGVTSGAIASLSGTNPTLPGSYTYKARVGWGKTDSSANKFWLGFTQSGGSVEYRLGSNVPTYPSLGNGSTGGSLIAASTTGATPPTAGVIKTSFGFSGGTAGTIYIGANSSTANTKGMHLAAYIQTTNDAAPLIALDIVLQSSSIYWSSNVSNGYMICRGWEDNL